MFTAKQRWVGIGILIFLTIALFLNSQINMSIMNFFKPKENAYMRDHFALILPNKWVAEYNNDDTYTIYNPSGNGAMTLSSLTKDPGMPNISSEGLSVLVKNRGEIHTKQKGEYSISESKFDEIHNGNKWYTLAWAITRNDQMVIMTYAYMIEKLPTEEYNEVLALVDSIKLR